MKYNLKIADMHCHILPGLDDGSKDMEQTMSMIKIAYSEGVRLIIATPHYHIGKVKVDISEAKKLIETIKESIKEKYPDLEIYCGQEIYYYSEAMEDIENKRAATMAGSEYVLLEFSTDVSYTEITSAIYDTTSHGYHPILAHIERYECLAKRPDRIAELIEAGAYMQVNAKTVAGEYGKQIQKFIKKLLKKEYIHFISSDAHSDRSRAPHFNEAEKVLSKACSAEYYKKILWENVIKIINNEEI